MLQFKHICNFKGLGELWLQLTVMALLATLEAFSQSQY